MESHLFFSSSGEHPGGSTGRKEGKSLGELTGEEGVLALKAVHRRVCVGRWGGVGGSEVMLWCVQEVGFREGCGHWVIYFTVAIVSLISSC